MSEKEADPKWSVWRMSGRRGAEWLAIYLTENEADARKRYQKIYEALRQGGVRLFDPTGKMLRQFTAPRLRTRW